MIKPLTMFTVICDSCGKDSADGTDYSGWSDKGYAVECAEELGFETIDDNHYCIDCWEYNDEDELIVKKP
jgi:hypothetical protein